MQDGLIIRAGVGSKVWALILGFRFNNVKVNDRVGEDVVIWECSNIQYSKNIESLSR